MAPHSSTLTWKIPWTEEPGGLQSMGSLGVGHDWATSLSLFTFMHWRRKWQPTPVFLPGECQGRGSLVGCRLWGRTESDTADATQQSRVLPSSLDMPLLITNILNWGLCWRSWDKPKGAVALHTAGFDLQICLLRLFCIYVCNWNWYSILFLVFFALVFISFQLCWVFVAEHRLSLVAASGAPL